jgi:acyl-CoA synthetase (NDP forming)
MTIRHLDSLLSRKSFALIGASDCAGSLGAVMLKNLQLGQFGGPV